MRKRSSYRPRRVRLDVMGYVIQGITPLRNTGDAGLVLKIKNHDSLAAIAKGTATAQDVQNIISALNIAEALAKARLGLDYLEEIDAGQRALESLASRGVERGRFVCTGPELTAINAAMDIHDAQLDLTTIYQIEKAIETVERTIRTGGARVIQ